jgi:hypothetical protein
MKICRNPTFTRDVEVMTPCDGGHIRETLKVTYRVIPVDQAAKYDLAKREEVTQLLRDIVVRLDDLTDEKDKPISYCDEVRDHVFAMPHSRIAIARTYFDAVTSAREGN